MQQPEKNTSPRKRKAPLGPEVFDEIPEQPEQPISSSSDSEDEAHIATCRGWPRRTEPVPTSPPKVKKSRKTKVPEDEQVGGAANDSYGTPPLPHPHLAAMAASLVDLIPKSSGAPRIDPPKFSGLGNVHVWAKQFESTVSFYTEERYKIAQLSSALTDDAAVWYASEMDSGRTRDLKQWLELIEQQFASGCTQEEKEIEARKYQAGRDDPRAFVERVVSRVNRMTCCRRAHKDRLNLILQGTMSEHPQRDELMANFPDTAEGLISRLHTMESRPTSHIVSGKPTKVNAVATSEPTIQVSSPPQAVVPDNLTSVKSQLIAQMSEVIAEVAQSFSRNYPRRNRADELCHYCSKPGHYERVCRKKARDVKNGTSNTQSKNNQGNGGRSGV